MLCFASCKHDTTDKVATPVTPAPVDSRDAWVGDYFSMGIESHPDGNMPPNTIIDTTACHVYVHKGAGDSIIITTPSNSSTVRFSLNDTLPGSLFYHWRFASNDSIYVGYMGGLSHFWSYAGKK